MEVLEYSWQELSDDVITLAKAVHVSLFKPQRVVGIVRGGAVPAVMMSHILGVPFETVTWSRRDYGEKQTSKWLEIVKESNEGLKTLIVEDIVDSGETLLEMQLIAANEFNGQGWKRNIRIASLFYNTNQRMKVDYTVRLINRKEDDRWIRFPWELIEG